MGDEWTVIGASGKPKKSHKAQPHHSHQDIPQLPGWGAASSAPAPGREVMPGTSPDDGWGDYPTASTANSTSASAQGADGQGRRGRKGARKWAPRERTPQEVAAWLATTVEEARAWVVASPMYATLRTAMQDAHTRLSPHWQQAAPREQQAGQQQHPPSELRTAQQPTQPPLQQHASDGAAPSIGCVCDEVIQGNGAVAVAAAGASGVAATSHVRGAMPGVCELVVYGLGSPQESRTARYQLALAVQLVRELLPGLSRPPLAFDPAFTPADETLLAALGFEVLRVNEGCARRAHDPTFFYLPHLEGHLTDNLLAANLGLAPPYPVEPSSHQTQQRQPQTEDSELDGGGAHVVDAAARGGSGAGGDSSTAQPQGGAESAPQQPAPAAQQAPAVTLHHVVMLGNAFTTYADRWGTAGRGSGGSGAARGHLQAGPKRPDVMLGLLAGGRVVQAVVPDGRDFLDVPSAFNDMALHTFPPLVEGGQVGSVAVLSQKAASNGGHINCV